MKQRGETKNYYFYRIRVKLISVSEFLTFVNNQEQCQLKWKESVSECVRLKTELDICNTKITEFEKKLNRARVLLDSEKKRALRAEKERDELVCFGSIYAFQFFENRKTLHD